MIAQKYYFVQHILCYTAKVPLTLHLTRLSKAPKSNNGWLEQPNNIPVGLDHILEKLSIKNIIKFNRKM